MINTVQLYNASTYVPNDVFLYLSHKLHTHNIIQISCSSSIHIQRTNLFIKTTANGHANAIANNNKQQQL